MNIEKLEEKLNFLVSSLNKESFIYDLLLAYGHNPNLLLIDCIKVTVSAIIDKITGINQNRSTRMTAKAEIAKFSRSK